MSQCSSASVCQHPPPSLHSPPPPVSLQPPHQQHGARSNIPTNYLLCFQPATIVSLMCCITCNTITHLIVLLIEVNNSFILQRHSSLLLIAALPICKYLMRKHSIMHNSHICVGSWFEYKYLTLADFQVFRLRYCIVIHSLPSCLFICCHAIMSFIWIILIILGHPLSNLVIILPSCCNREKPQKIFFLNDNMF